MTAQSTPLTAGELFDTTGRLIPDLSAMAPTGARRMSANPHANGGLLLRDLRLPDFRDYAVNVPWSPATAGKRRREQSAAGSRRSGREIDPATS
jgi:phosphoketolase